MEKKLKAGSPSHYEIEITITAAEEAHEREHVLAEFQKDVEVQGFRKGHVPLDLVEKNVKPEYITIGIYEHVINHGIQEILQEQPDKKFIGEPYDVKPEKVGDKIVVSFKLDVYPEVKIVDENWKKQTIKKINSIPDKKEIDDALLNLKKNYADYQDADAIQADTVSKVIMEFLNKENEVIDKGSLFLGEQEFNEFELFKKLFFDKKKDETLEHAYDEKKLPALVHSKKEDKPHKIKFTVKDIKKIVLPEWNEETIGKLFGPESQVKTEKELVAYITTEIGKQKEEMGLVKAVEEYINSIRGKSIKVEIPKTFIDAEIQARIQSLEKQLGGKEKMEEYFSKMGKEKQEEFTKEITATAKESLEKFTILMKIAELLELGIDRNKTGHFEVEKKLYEKVCEK